MNHFYILLTALFTSLLLVPLLRRWALDRGTVDHPSDRKVHLAAVPRLGGIAVFLSLLLALLSFSEITRPLRAVLAGSVIIFLTGLVDDLQGLKPRWKFLGQAAACSVTMVLGDLHIQSLGNLLGTGEIILPLWVAIPFTLFAVIGVINAINLIDGLDGLAGGVSLIALLAFFLLGYRDGNILVMTLSAGLFGSLLGFLKYNFYPARIFMGDTGSLTVGFILAFLAILLTQSETASVPPFAPVLILGLPIIDTIWVMSRRLVKGESPFTPDLTHVHHKFLDLGFQHRFTVLIIYGISFFWATVAVVFHETPELVLLLAYLLISALFYLALRHVLRHRDRYPFLRRDSTAGIRESVTYKQLVHFCDLPLPVISGLLFLYLGLATYVGCNPCEPFLPLFGPILAGSVLLLLVTRSSTNPFLLLLLYLGGLALIFTVERAGPGHVLFGLRASTLGDSLVLGLALFSVLKILFRNPGEFFLSSIDFLVLGTTLLLAIFFYHLQNLPDLGGTLLRGLVFYHAIKVVAARGRPGSRILVASMLVALLTVTLRGLV